MGFNSVYRGLVDIFPQVDARILRAVAIENSKDADKAVEVVLTEVIPFIPSNSGSSNDSQESTQHEDILQSGSNKLNETVGIDQICRLNGKQVVSFCSDENNGMDQVCGSSGKQPILSVKSKSVTESIQSSNVNSTISRYDDWPSNLDCLVESNLEQLCLNTKSLDVENSVAKLAPPTANDCPSDASEIGLQHTDDGTTEETEIPDADSMNVTPTIEAVNFVPEPMKEVSNCEVVDSDHEPIEDALSHEVVDFEHEPVLNTEVSRSGQICRIDLLEDIIEEARDNKKTLFLAMESVISLMRDVEVREKAAEQLKEEAAKGGLDILARVDDIKQMLQHAKEANDLHVGEVYGEKAILATEAKELQSRLLSLSDERDKSLAILDEMRQTLEQRLDAVEKAMKDVEEEKMEKEAFARNALAEQELIMAKVVLESKLLKQEAEENSKLQEFLMDRGRVVDTLQGEIAVICKDIKLLKEKFDERAPLSESLSSSQTSCRLASSSSSLKSLALDQVPGQTETPETPKKISPATSIRSQLSSGDERKANVSEAFLDDGWEFCDNKELNI